MPAWPRRSCFPKLHLRVSMSIAPTPRGPSAGPVQQRRPSPTHRNIGTQEGPVADLFARFGRSGVAEAWRRGMDDTATAQCGLDTRKTWKCPCVHHHHPPSGRPFPPTDEPPREPARPGWCPRCPAWGPTAMRGGPSPFLPPSQSPSTPGASDPAAGSGFRFFCSFWRRPWLHGC